MFVKSIIKVISFLIDVALCWYAFLRLVDGTAKAIHYSILIGSALALVFFILEKLRENVRERK